MEMWSSFDTHIGGSVFVQSYNGLNLLSICYALGNKLSLGSACVHHTSLPGPVDPPKADASEVLHPMQEHGNHNNNQQ